MNNENHPYIELLKQYEMESNQHHVEACIAFFTPHGAIVMDDEVYQGESALRDAHEYDLGSNTQVRFNNFKIEGNIVRCAFWNEHELSRVLESNGMNGEAEFSFSENKIERFNILPPNEEERQRVMAKVGPGFTWLRENHPDAVARWKGFNRAAGEAVFHLAQLWREHLAAGSNQAAENL